MKASRAAAFLLAVLFCGIAAVSTSAATLVVTKTEDTNDGVCDADCSLREAVSVANADDTVVFSSLFNTPQTITLTLGQIALTRNLSITGSGSNLLTVSGNNAGRIFYISGGASVSLAGMTLRDGRNTTIDSFGGGIYVTDSALNLVAVVMFNNYVFYQPFGLGYGGAIFCQRGTLNIAGSTIQSNTAVAGGGISTGLSIINISNSNIGNNTGAGVHGGGNDQITVVGSTIDSNSTFGIVANAQARIYIENSTISNNRTGGIFGGDSKSEMNIDHSVISGNTNVIGLNRDTGGIRNRGAASIRYCTIVNNRASGRGGGIDNTGTMYVQKHPS
jgi:CSLREA domain-containing protein